MPFEIVLSCNPHANGCALFTEISLCPTILSSALALLGHIHASGNTAPLAGYLIHSHQYTSTELTHHFWDIQVHIVLQLQTICSLSMVMAFFHPDHNCCAVTINFTQQLCSSGWIITDTPISFPSFGDLVLGTCCLIVTVHSNMEENCCAFEICTPPHLPTQPIAWYIWARFNKPKLAVLYSKDDKSFNNHAINDNGLQPLQASIPSDAQHMAGVDGVQVKINFIAMSIIQPTWLVQQSSVLMASAPCSTPLPILMFLGTTSALSSSTMGMLTSVQFPLLNFSCAFASPTSCHTLCHTHPMLSAWTSLSPPLHGQGFSSMSLTGAYKYAATTLIFFAKSIRCLCSMHPNIPQWCHRCLFAITRPIGPSLLGQHQDSCHNCVCAKSGHNNNKEP